MRRYWFMASGIAAALLLSAGAVAAAESADGPTGNSPGAALLDRQSVVIPQTAVATLSDAPAASYQQIDRFGNRGQSWGRHYGGSRRFHYAPRDTYRGHGFHGRYPQYSSPRYRAFPYRSFPYRSYPYRYSSPHRPYPYRYYSPYRPYSYRHYPYGTYGGRYYHYPRSGVYFRFRF